MLLYISMTYPKEMVSSSAANNHLSIKKSPPFMKYKSSFPYSQKTTTGPWSKTSQSTLNTPKLFLNPVLFLWSNLLVIFLPLGVPITILCLFSSLSPLVRVRTNRSVYCRATHSSGERRLTNLAVVQNFPRHLVNMDSRVPSQDISREIIFVVSVTGKVYVQVLRCSLVSVFAPMLHTHLHLNTNFIERTSGCRLGSFKEMFFLV